MIVALASLPERDRFAVSLLIDRALSGWRSVSVADGDSAGTADLCVIDVEAWKHSSWAETDWADWIGARRAVLLAPTPSLRDDVRQEAERNAAAWAERGWFVVERPFRAEGLRDALERAARFAPAPPPAAAPTRFTLRPPVPPAPAATPVVVPRRTTGFVSTSIFGIVDQPVSKPRPIMREPQIGDGALSIEAFNRVQASSPHEVCRDVLAPLGRRLVKGLPFEIVVTMINGAVFHPAEGWAATNTPLPVLRMVMHSRILSEHVQLVTLDSSVDPRARAQQRGMTFHTLEALLYALASAADCKL